MRLLFVLRFCTVGMGLMGMGVGFGGSVDAVDNERHWKWRGIHHCACVRVLVQSCCQAKTISAVMSIVDARLARLSLLGHGALWHLFKHTHDLSMTRILQEGSEWPVFRGRPSPTDHTVAPIRMVSSSRVSHPRSSSVWYIIYSCIIRPKKGCCKPMPPRRYMKEAENKKQRKRHLREFCRVLPAT